MKASQEEQLSIEIESGVIQELGYDEQSKSLVIQFVKGAKGRYTGVPRELVGQMLQAKSVGAFFVAHIRNAFPYEPIAA